MLARILTRQLEFMGLHFCLVSSCFARQGPPGGHRLGQRCAIEHVSKHYLAISPHAGLIQPSIILHLQYLAWIPAGEIRARHDGNVIG